jgi:hypothetical protein
MIKEVETDMIKTTGLIFYEILNELVKECFKKEDIEEFKKLNDMLLHHNPAFLPFFIYYHILGKSGCIKIENKEKYLNDCKKDPFVVEKAALDHVISLFTSLKEFLDEAGEDVINKKDKTIH